MGDLFGAVIRLLIFLPLVGLLAYITIKYGLGQRASLMSPGHVKVLERIPLNQRTALCVIMVGDRYYLLAASEQGASLLKELEDYPGPPSGRTAPGPLLSGLARRWKGWGGDGHDRR